MPVGYFRTYTYQPMTFQTQSLTGLPSYHLSSRLVQSPLATWPQKQMQMQASQQGPAQVAPPVPQQPQQQPPQQPSQPQSQSPQLPQIVQQVPSSPITATTYMASGPQSMTQKNGGLPTHGFSNENGPTSNMLPIPTISDFMPQQTQQQFTPNQYYQPMRPNSYLADPLNLQYTTNMNYQQVQFVPCMCPVSVSIAPEIIADKRSDEVITEAQDPAPVEDKQAY